MLLARGGSLLVNYLNYIFLILIEKMVTINIRKKDLLAFISVIFFIIGMSYVIAVWNPAAHPMSHNSDDVKVTIAGNNYSLQEAIDAGLLGGAGGLGVWQDLTAVASGGVVQGPVTTDGFVVALGATDGSFLIGYTNSTAAAPAIRVYGTVHAGGSYGTISFTMPVRKGDYWKVVGPASSIYWIPFT
jgi:hypothetical protein